MKTNLKDICARVLFVTALCTNSSCNNDLLDLAPQTDLSDATAFTTPERIALAVAGVYDAAQSGFYAGNQVRGYPFGAAHIQQGDNRGEDVVNTQAFYLITYSNTVDPSTPNNDFYFQTLFALINRSNVVLEGLAKAVPSATLSQSVIDSYKGEVRFLRALAYSELMIHFCKPYSDNPNAAAGGMPVRATAITNAKRANEAAQQGRNTVAECYTFMLDDLSYAESVLPENRTPVSLRISRATKAAAVALKMRLLLRMQRWSDVITEGNKLASQTSAPFTPASGFGSYNLPSNPYVAFSAPGSKNNTESIFSIENSAEDNPGGNAALPTMYSTSLAPTSGRALVAISPLIWNQPWFLASDTRKSTTFVSFGELTTAGGKGGYFSKKYTDVSARSDNAPVLRYAEVLLTLAEAIQRNSGGAVDTRAHALFNAVRSRSVNDPATDDVGDFTDGNALIRAILNERRIEFLCEGLRWGDVHRLAQDPIFNTWGGGVPAKISAQLTNFRPYYTGDMATNATILGTANLRHSALPYTDSRFLWPIPYSETNLNPILAKQQNPGY